MKNLAAQTTKAAEDISVKFSEMRPATAP